MAASSGSRGRGLELSQSCSSSALGSSGGAFESFGEEEESEAAGPCCSPAGSGVPAARAASHSAPWPAGRSRAEESEVEDSAAVGRDAIGKWIEAMGKGIDLNSDKTDMKQDKSVIRAPAEIAEFSAGELDALSSFCTSMIRRMQQELADRGKARKLQWGVPARPAETGDGSCAVPAQLLNRILLQNSREAAKQVIEAQIHEPSACPECQQKEAELARVAFLRHKKALLEGALIQEKLEQQFYSRDVLTLIGEALSSFPKPSEDPRDLWQRLKGQEM